MPKRRHSAVFNANISSDMLVEADYGYGTLKSQGPAPPSPLALPSMPGQWEPIYVPKTVEPAVTALSSSFYTTVAKLMPTIASLKDHLYTATSRIVNKFTRQQQIRAEPVIRADGSRKKILIDAGLACESSTPKRRAKNNGPTLWYPTPRASSTPDVPGFWLDSPENYNTSNEFSGLGDSPFYSPRQPSPQPAQASWSEHQYAYDIDSRSPQLPDSPDFSSLPQSTPHFIDDGLSIPTETPCPTTRHTKTIVPTPVAKPIQLLHHRVQQLSESSGMHTSRSPSPKSNNLQHKYLKSVAFKDKVEETALKAHTANELYKANHGAQQVKNAAIQAQQQKENKNEDSVKLSFPSDVLYQDEDMPTTADYSADMSTLPDAPTPPPRRNCHWTPRAHVKPFFRDTVIDEMLDSTLETIKSSPFQEIVGVPEDESSLSIEVLEDIQKLALSTPEKERTPTPQPQPPPAPIQKPLVPPMLKDDLKKLLEVVQLTDSGRLQADVVKGRIDTHDVQTLLPSQFNGPKRAWLNDNIVNEYLAILIDHKKAECGYTHRRGGPAPPVHAFASQWYQSASRNLKLVERWASKKQLGGRNLLDCGLLLIPVCDGGHWRLLAIKPKDRTIEYLDSLQFGGADIVTKAVEWLKQELGELWKEEEWTMIEKRSMKQLNGNDCGVFTILNSLALLRGEDPSRVVPIDGMEEARRRILVSLYSREVTGEL